MKALKGRLKKYMSEQKYENARSLSSDWHVTLDASNEQAYAILAQDRVWNSFALADLEAPLRAYSQFAVASRPASDEYAICLILRHPILGQVLSPFGREEGVAAILKNLALPEYPLLQTQEMHLPLLQQYYRAETAWKRLMRMAIISDAWEPARPLSAQAIIKQLSISDLPALKTLYTQYPDNHFSADLFAEGLYFGVYEGERIIAAGGTHALVPAHRIAVLGNILTAPEARGRGYATAITATLVTELCKRHFSLVVLNVFEDNLEALRIYERLGFQTHCEFLTGRAVLQNL